MIMIPAGTPMTIPTIAPVLRSGSKGTVGIETACKVYIERV